MPRSADEAMAAMRDMMRRLKLTVNEAKTRTCKLPADSFDFLSYTIGMYWSWPQRWMVLSTRPSAKVVQRLKAKKSGCRLGGRTTSVGETRDQPRPRAGCGKSARPVR